MWFIQVLRLFSFDLNLSASLDGRESTFMKVLQVSLGSHRILEFAYFERIYVVVY